MCRADGLGLHTGMARQVVSFLIEARDAAGTHQEHGGDPFVVAIRGPSPVHAKVVDNVDGTYRCEYKPAISGNYTIAVSLHGVPIDGSPFHTTVMRPRPDASKCKVSGDGLHEARAREPATIEVAFHDLFGQPTYARMVACLYTSMYASMHVRLP